MDEVLGVIPGGPWTVAAVGLLAIPGVRRQLRPVAKVVLRTGIRLTDQAKSWAAEAREQSRDLVAQTRADQTASRARATTGI